MTQSLHPFCRPLPERDCSGLIEAHETWHIEYLSGVHFRSVIAPASLKRVGRVALLRNICALPERDCSGLIEAIACATLRTTHTHFRSVIAPASLKQPELCWRGRGARHTSGA